MALKVFFTWHGGTDEVVDYGFRRAFKWDIPLTEGYESEVVRNVSADPGTHRFTGLRNPALVDAVLSWQPDVVHLTGYAWLSHLRALRAFHRRGLPVVFRGDSHLLDASTGHARGWLKRRVLRTVYRWPAAFLCVGAANRAYYSAMGVGPDRLYACPHSIDVARFAADAPAREAEAREWRRELGIAQGTRVLLFAGKFEPRKRPLELMRAFLAAELPESVLVMVGDGELGDEVKRIAGGAPERLHVLPFQNQSRMPVVYRLGDLFVLPSAYAETWGLAVNEAMACGRAAVVSSRVGCSVDMVDASCGAEFPADDWPSLTAIVSRLVRDPERLRRMGLEAARRAAKFDIEATATTTLNCVRDVLRPRSPHAGPRFICVGFFGRPNFGDELLCWVVDRELRELFPGSQLSFVTHDCATSALFTGPWAGLIEGAFPSPRFFLNLAEQVRAVRQADLVVVGGGGLVNDYYSWTAIPRFAILACLAFLFAKPVVFVGLGVAGVRRAWLARLARFALAGARGVYCRDAESLDRVSRWLAAGEPKLVAPDLAVLAVSRLDEISGSGGTRPAVPYLLANFRDHPEVPLATLVGICRAALQRCPELVLMASEVHDLALYRRIAGALNAEERARTVIEFPRSLRTALVLIRAASWVVAERLHVNLAAAMVGCPVYAIEYEDKVTAQMAGVLRHPLRCRLDALSTACVDEVIRGRAASDGELIREAEFYAREALRQVVAHGLEKRGAAKSVADRAAALLCASGLVAIGFAWSATLVAKRAVARLLVAVSLSGSAGARRSR
ncbi:MAG: glycosyltransferase [Burkholderiales bacterium]|nr:glycosyltransferase [Burkholderiales bacterium]